MSSRGEPAGRHVSVACIAVSIDVHIYALYDVFYINPDESGNIGHTWELWTRDESDFDICPFGILHKMIFDNTGSWNMVQFRWCSEEKLLVMINLPSLFLYTLMAL